MALSVVTKSIEVERLVGETAVQLPVRAEALVSGAGRESVEVLMADGYASVGGTEAQAGRVVVSGTIYCQAAYRLGQDGGARALTAQAPFEQIAEIEGVTPRMSVQVWADVDHVEADYESGHMVFQAVVTLKVRVCSLDTVEAVSEIQGLEGVQTRTEEVCSAKLNAETSDMVALRDEVRLPAELNARVTLMQWAEPVVSKAERDLGGVRVSGEARVEALIASGVAGRPVALVRYALPFEQLISLPDWITGDAEAAAEIGRLSVDVEEGGEGEDATLKLECDVSLTVRMNGQDCMTVLTDAYATGESALETAARTLKLCAGTRRCQGQENLKSTMLLPEGAPGVGTVLAVRVHPAVSGWRNAGGRSIVEGVLEATVLYMPAGGGALRSVQAELPFEVKMDCELAEDAWVRVTAADAEASALMSDRLELRCTLRGSAMERVTSQATVLTGAEETEAAPLPGGVGICYPQRGETLWSIGRRYRISEEALKAANAGVEEAAEGHPLLILRGRSAV